MALGKARSNRHKIVLIGPSAAVKTSIIHRYAKGNFYDGIAQPTIGTAFYSHEVEAGGHHVSLNIWDTAGMERYKSLVPKYAKGAAMAVIVFDTDLILSLLQIRSTQAAQLMFMTHGNLQNRMTRFIWKHPQKQVRMWPYFLRRSRANSPTGTRRGWALAFPPHHGTANTKKQRLQPDSVVNDASIECRPFCVHE
jgi:small GTP-binding protein